MKKEKVIPEIKGKKIGPGSNLENKVKKGTGDSAVIKTMAGSVGNVKAKSGRGLSNEGTTVDYNEERRFSNNLTDSMIASRLKKIKAIL